MVTTTLVMRRHAQFNQVSQRLPDRLEDTDEPISAGLATRLQRYATKRLAESGFDVSGADCEVYSMDADDAPPDRLYTVEFTNAKGGRIGVQGILTAHGWPALDHGLCIGGDQ